MTQQKHYQAMIQRELRMRIARNNRYSIRAFARSMGLNHGALSQILSGKRVPSKRTALKLADRLSLAPRERAIFLASLAETHRNRKLLRINALIKEHDSPATPHSLDHRTFEVISEWYHTALLELTFVEGFKADTAWIASKMGISRVEAKLAVERLLSLGLLTRSEGTLVKAHGQLTTANKEVTSAALKLHQKQILERAALSLENDPLEERSMSGMVMAINPEKLPLARKLIDSFSRALYRALEDGPRTRVYQLGVSLYPVSKDSSEKI